MSILSNILPIAQILISVALITVILLQQRGGGLGIAFGGSDASYHTKRGIERILFILTIIFAVLFALTGLLALIFK